MKTTKKLFSSIRLGTFSTVLIVLSACSTGNTQTNTGKLDNTTEPPSIDLNTAALTGNLEAVNQHIKAGTDLNQKEPFGGSTPLITAIVFGKSEAAKMLMEAGADLDIQNNDGSTALHCAAFFCHPEIVKNLLAAGARTDIKNNYQVTPYESMQGSWEDMKPVYEMQQAMLGGYGLKLDMDRIERTRPEVVRILK